MLIPVPKKVHQCFSLSRGVFNKQEGRDANIVFVLDLDSLNVLELFNQWKKLSNCENPIDRPEEFRQELLSWRSWKSKHRMK